MNAVPSRLVIPDSYRSNFQPFYLQPPHPFLSFCSLCSPGIGRGFSVLPSRVGFRLGFVFKKQTRQCIRPNRVHHCFVYGLVVRFRLLPTPPLDDAVAFCYGQTSASVRRGLSPHDWCVLSGALLLSVPDKPGSWLFRSTFGREHARWRLRFLVVDPERLRRAL